MNIDDLTIGEAKQLAGMFGFNRSTPTPTDSAWEIGKIYLIRTVTMTDTGRLVKVTEYELVLEDAAWIADTGRFSDAIKKAEFGEVEPFPDDEPLIIGRGSIVDAIGIKQVQRRQK